MTLLIPFLGPDATELRYCLRSYEQYFNITELIIIGADPDLHNYTHIPFKDTRSPQWAHRNVWQKLLLGPDEFLWSADDVYMRCGEVLPWATGLLSNQVNRRGDSLYRQTLFNTMDVLPPASYAYNTHAPMYVTQDMLRAVDVDWDRPHGYCIKTMLSQHLTPVVVTDTKLRFREQIPQAPFFSSSPTWMRCWGRAKLEKLYPRPSKWEK